MNKIKLGDKLVGKGDKPYFIADIGANHDGNLERAYKPQEGRCPGAYM